MLQQERSGYIDYLCKGLKDYIPPEITDQNMFSQKVQERIRKVGRKKKQGEGQGEGNKDEDEEDNENIFFSEEDEEEDDVKFGHFSTT